VVALDATRDHRDDEIRTALRGLVDRGDILRAGDSLLVLGVLYSITHPSKDAHPLRYCPYFYYLTHTNLVLV
jgi:interleukin-1 receptor-associated kinase 1